MTDYVEQLERTISSHSSLLIADMAISDAIEEAVNDYLNGDLNDRQIRFALERVAREHYRSNARAAQELVRDLTEQNQRWTPVPLEVSGEALRIAVKDIQRNLREFKDSDGGESARALLEFRVRLSAEYASQKGFSDGMELSYKAVEEQGKSVYKVWVATYHSGDTCTHCLKLHGQIARVGKEFIAPAGLNVYGTLHGPQAHISCRCTAVYFVAADKDKEKFETGEVNLPLPTPGSSPRMIGVDDVSLLPLKVFMAILKALMKAVASLRTAAGL